MNLLDRIPANKVLKGQLVELTDQLNKTIKSQELVGLKLSQFVAQQNAYVGNAYRTYETAIKEIENKYNATAAWGVTLTGNIIDLRAAFIIGNGLKIVRAEGVKIGEAEAEMAFADDLMQWNKLDKEMVQELAKEAEIEGKIALHLQLQKTEDNWHDREEMVSIRYISWLEKNYKIKTKENDYMAYEEMLWQPTSGEQVKTVPAKEFVYNKFGGRITKPNDAQPKIMKCLTQIDDVDYALRDWREINRIFATPILDAECDTEDAVSQMKTQLADFNMKIKKALIHTDSRIKLIGPDMAGVDSLEKEIIAKLKIISGNTSLPIHYLGLIDLLKNRSTGENTREVVNAGTSKERAIWAGTWQEAIEKSMALYNASNNSKLSKGKQLDPRKIQVIIPVYTQEQWDHIETVLLPMYQQGAISIETLLRAVPDLDAEEELARLSDKETSELDEAKAENDALKSELKFQQTINPKENQLTE